MPMEHPLTQNPTFKNPIQEFTFYRTYSRFNKDKGRRETFDECIERLMNHLGDPKFKGVVSSSIRRLEVFPSMRYLWSAGPAVDAENAMAYNCAYMKFDKPDDFGDLAYLLMCGVS